MKLETKTYGAPGGEREYLVAPSGTHYHKGTSPAVIAALEPLVGRDVRVRVWWGDVETGKCWGDEHDVLGRLGRSWGPAKVPLLVYNRRSMGGGALLTDCLLRVVRTDNGRVVYQHPKWQKPVYRVVPFPYRDNPPEWLLKQDPAAPLAYAGGAEVLEEGGWKLVAAFHKTEQAERWVKFMTGERFAK